MTNYKLDNYFKNWTHAYFLYRFLVCLPFITIVLYAKSYHGELINNAQVEWQYVKSDENRVYLALDVYSPSGIKIDGIFSRGREITDSWRLVNYPDWYKGEDNFKALSKFQDILHPYLPYNNDFKKLYTATGWYTFLYEWNPVRAEPIPDEKTIKIKYKNIGTQNSYWAKHVSGTKINTIGIDSKVEAFVSGLKVEDFEPQNDYIYLDGGISNQVYNVPGKYVYTNGLEIRFYWKLINQKGKTKAACVVNYFNSSNKLTAKIIYVLAGSSDYLKPVSAKTDGILWEVTERLNYRKGALKFRKNLYEEFNIKLSLLLDNQILIKQDILQQDADPSYITVMFLAQKESSSDEIELEIENLSINSEPTVDEEIFNGKDRPTFNIPILNPLSDPYKNLKFSSYFSEFMYRGVKRNDYVLSIQDEKGNSIDTLKGIILWDKEKACHVYYKTHEVNETKRGITSVGYIEIFRNLDSIDALEIFRHLVSILFVVYLVLICRYVGYVFIKWRNLVLDNYIANFVVSTLLGVIFLTYFFFVIGILELLYFHVVFGVLLTILFLSCELYKEDISNWKVLLISEFKRVKEHPWRIIFIILLTSLLSYNLFYCFLPATFCDGSGDVINNYLPLLDSYINSHSFKAPIQDSTIGLNSQATDILRTVVKIFIGEPGVCLLSFVYLLGILGAVYLIGKELFNINSMLIYITAMLFFYLNFFTEYIHLGKQHTAVLSFLLISLYSIRFSDHDKNYILIPLFFTFLTSQYAFFLIVPLSYYLFVFSYSFYTGMKPFESKLHAKSLLLFLLLCPIFYLKLINEVGVCFPPGSLPTWLHDFFLKYNQENELYKFIDNNYMRHFYYKVDFGGFYEIEHISSTITGGMRFAVILLFSPLIRKVDKYTIRYILATIVIVLWFVIFSPRSPRLTLYYMFPLIILQIAIIDGIVSAFSFKRTLIILLLFIISDLHNRSKYTPVRGMKDVFSIFIGKKSKYQYLSPGEHPEGSQRYFDHAMLIRDYTNVTDTILIIPITFHSATNRYMTARHALGSVIYQKDINKIMADLKRFNINYLSFIPLSTCGDYNPYYTPIFEKENFKRYFKLLFSDHNKKFYKIMHDGTNTQYSPSPYDVEGLPFIPMLKEDQI